MSNDGETPLWAVPVVDVPCTSRRRSPGPRPAAERERPRCGGSGQPVAASELSPWSIPYTNPIAPQLTSKSTALAAAAIMPRCPFNA
jgi:hypothetical protein